MTPTTRTRTPLTREQVLTEAIMLADAIEDAGGVDSVAWQREGEASEAPPLAPAHHAGVYRLGVLDLLKPAADATDQELATEIRRQLAGGVDAAAVRQRFEWTGKEGQGKPQALEATTVNAARNGVADRIACESPESFAEDRADIVLANILAGPLIELAPLLTGCLKPGGNLVLSGLLEEQAKDVAAAYRPACAPTGSGRAEPAGPGRQPPAEDTVVKAGVLRPGGGAQVLGRAAPPRNPRLALWPLTKLSFGL